MKLYYLLLLMCFPSLASAEENLATINVDTVWVATAAALVFLMQAGFALLESGCTRSKNAVNVVMKNYMDVCLGTLIFWCVGYGIMFGSNPTGLFGTDQFFLVSSDPWDYTVVLFQMLFAATAATIASGAMAERTRFHGYLIGAVLIIGLIYPVVGSWIWNAEGWLAKQGFIDFAGSTVVHSTGAWVALAGIIIVGARTGRFDADGKPREIPGHNLNLVALGGFILWFGWFGFNGGSTLAADANIGLINLNTQLAAGAGAVGAMLMSRFMGQALLLTVIVNGSLAGLVAITAGCATMTPPFAIITGLIGGAIATSGAKLLLTLRLDDVVGAIPVHGFAGAWGTIAAGMFLDGDLFNKDVIFVQIVGVIICFIWAFLMTMLVYKLVSNFFGLRADTIHEQRGLDVTEHAEIGYPEFGNANPYDQSTLNAIKQ